MRAAENLGQAVLCLLRTFDDVEVDMTIRSALRLDSDSSHGEVEARQVHVRMNFAVVEPKNGCEGGKAGDEPGIGIKRCELRLSCGSGTFVYCHK